MPRNATDEWWKQWDALGAPQTAAASIVKAVLDDMAGRGGIKHDLADVEMDVVPQMLTELVEVVESNAHFAELRADKAIVDWMEKAKPHVGYLWGGPERFQVVVGRQDKQATGADFRKACATAMEETSDADSERA